jgi:hypothetical protein
VGRDGVSFTDVFVSAKNELFFRTGLDTPNQLEFAEQIKVCVKSNSKPAGSKHPAIAASVCPSGQIRHALFVLRLPSSKFSPRQSV